MSRKPFRQPVQQCQFSEHAPMGLMTELLVKYHEYQRPGDRTMASMRDFHGTMSFIGELAIVNPPIDFIYPSRANGTRRIYQAPNSVFGRFLLRTFPPGHEIWNHVRTTLADEPAGAT